MARTGSLSHGDSGPEILGVPRRNARVEVLNMTIQSLRYQLSFAEQVLTDDIYYSTNVARCQRNLTDAQDQLAKYTSIREAGDEALNPLREQIAALRKQRDGIKNEPDISRLLELQKILGAVG